MTTSLVPRALLPILLLSSTVASADVRLPALISDHMVLQQESAATVWGWADPQEKVSVSFAGQKLDTAADPEGKWRVQFGALKAGTSGELVIAGTNTVTIRDVLVGEVWLGSGQSNMEWSVAASANPQEEIAAANYPQIRMFRVNRVPHLEPQSNCEGKWEVCTPKTAPRFSAVAYYFGRKLHQDLKVPVGLIHSSWGGTPAEYWTPASVLAAGPEFKPILESWERVKAAYPEAKAKYDAAMVTWKEAAEKAKAEGAKPPNGPHAPRGGDAEGAPGSLFNGMIAPLIPYGIQGVIWYQGESNASQAALYRKLFPTMIMSWRQLWGSELPFLFVQLANFNARNVAPTGQPEESQWAELREAQLMTLELPRTAMAVAIDIGEGGDIHPKNKQDVGRRLALAAEATVYFQEVESSGPLFSGSQIEEGKVRLSFRHAEGLKPATGDKLKGFAIAGEDQKFVWADAEIQGDHVVLSSAEVAKPVAVRYGWADNPEVNLVNEAGLPASPFRTDTWPYRK
ncbi:MAG TPA: sialate O-acetylesterase [Chthoniobacteraceae bacterium]|jgi:sialate O-acetylesterase